MKVLPDSTVYTDQNRGYMGLKKNNYRHEAVNHSVGEYVGEQAAWRASGPL